MQKWAFVSFSAPKTELKITYRKLHHPIHYDLQIFLIKSLYPQQVYLQSINKISRSFAS